MANCIADTIFKKLSNFDIHVDVFVSKYIMYFFTVRHELFKAICSLACVIVDLKFTHILPYHTVMKSILVIYLEKWCN